jgi:hypothetical protein
MPILVHADNIARESYQKASRGETLLTDLGTPLHDAASPAPQVRLTCYSFARGRFLTRGSTPPNTYAIVPHADTGRNVSRSATFS